MTHNDKLMMLKVRLGIKNNSEDVVLETYLTSAREEILNWIYGDDIPSDVTEVPRRYEMIQIESIVAGYNLQGAENQTSHSEGEVSRSFKYSDMVAYIHNNVIPMAKVV